MAEVAVQPRPIEYYSCGCEARREARVVKVKMGLV